MHSQKYKSSSNTWILNMLFSLFILLLSTNAFCKELTNVTLILDWTPNTNHTGIIVAQKLGYYKNEGLNVKVIQPSKNAAEYVLAQNRADFAISSESSLVSAISKGLPIISIATIIAHDTSGFYSLKSKNITSPKDFEGKVYGSWGSEFELATIRTMMKQAGADFNKLKIVTIGTADFFTAKNIDFVWGFEAWTGIQAIVNNIPVNYISVRKTLKRDGFTPLIITTNNLVNNNPELVQKFMRATTKGFKYAIAHPTEAANILLENYPELSSNLVKESQKFLANRYKDDSKCWGYQNPETWKKYVIWVDKNKLIPKHINYKDIFTNQFTCQ